MTRKALPIALAAAALAAHGVEMHQIIQKKRAFSQTEISVAVGDVVRFTNDDEFIHQVYVSSDSFNFDTAESEPGNNIDMKFTTRGNFEVHCHIHPKMQLIVHVQ